MTAVHHAVELCLGCRNHTRVVVPQIVYGDAAAEIEDLAAVIGIQIAARRVVDAKRQIVLCHRRHNRLGTCFQIGHDTMLPFVQAKMVSMVFRINCGSLPKE